MTAPSSGDGGQRVLRIGKYEVQAYIATGGMGAVYRAVDADLGRTVALKILQPDLAKRPKVVERFRREARSAARLNHENIVTVYEFADVKGTYVLALEYIDGIDLHQYVASQGRRPAEEACRITMQAARALAHAHGQGIIHRDIKPSNFLLTQRDGKLHVKLTDFGLARAVGEDEPVAIPQRAMSGPDHYVARLTTLGSTVGTVDFMSPEQARDSGSADIRSDIYSLGCTLYFMLTGNCPFPGGTPTERLLKHVEQPVPDVREKNPEVPAGLAAVLERMLAKNPRERYQTPQELLHDLANIEHLNSLPAQSATIPVAPVSAPPNTLFAERTPPTGELVLSRKAKKTAPKTREPKRRKGPAPRRGKAKQGSGWLWAVAALGGLAITAAVIFLLVQMQSDSELVPDNAVVISSPDHKAPPQPVTPAETAQLFPIASKLTRLFTPSAPLHLKAMHDQYDGPLADVVSPVVGTVVFRVSRTPGGEPNAFRSVEEALARAPTDKPAAIEIHDNGPFFVPSLPALANRTVILRAGPGYRPLLAWDAAAGTEASLSGRFVALERGNLFLEDVDVVFKPDGTALSDPVLFKVDGGTFSAWNCSFSTAGNAPGGVALVHLTGSRGSSNCRLRRCYARGANLTAVRVDGTGAEAAEVLIEDSLLVGNEQPLLRVATGDDAWTTLRAVRSTLVAGRALLQVDAPAMSSGAPRVLWRGWDSVLARGSLQTPGALLVLGENVHADKMSWWALNCLYAGWQQLLSQRGTNVDATTLDAWHKQWLYSEGERALPAAWPQVTPAPVEQLPPVAYQTADTAASYAATSHAGPVGCDVSALPAALASWAKRTFEPIDIPPPRQAPPAAAPKSAGDSGPYPGEHVDLSKVDLGNRLQTVLAKRKPASRVVMELSGKAPRGSSPIRVRGFDLVLIFSASGSKAEPPTLASSPVHSREADALIDVEDGSLEIIDGRLSLAGLKPGALPKHLIRVRGGDLRLSDCRLTGPLGPDTGGFQSLIAFQGAGEEANDEPRACMITDSVLQTGKNVLQVKGTAARVQVRNSVIIAGDNALHFDFGAATPRLNLQCLLEHDTIAARGAVLDVPDVRDLPRITAPLLIRADANVFADPFVDVPRKSSVLRFSGTPIPRGALLWQGKGNVFDQRLHAFAVRADGLDQAPGLKEWRRLWGTPGERQPVSVQWPASAKTTFSLEIPRPERLAVPPDAVVRPDQPPPGADLVALKLLRK